MHGYTVGAIKDGKINAGLEIGHVIDEGFKDDERVDNNTSSILVIVGDVVKGIGAILGAADVPGAGAVTGVINAGLNIAANLTRKTYGGSFTFERTVDTIAHDQAQVVEDFSEIVKGFDLQIKLISGDWGKLNRFHDVWVNRWKFTSDDFDTDLPTSLALAYQRHVAEQVTTQFYAALQRGMLSMDQFHEWGINWNFGEDFNFDTSWDPQTLQTRRPDDRVDVILIKTAPLLTADRAKPSQWKRDRPFPEVLDFLTTTLGVYKPDIYRRWALTWTRCDWVSDHDIDFNIDRPRDCRQECAEDFPDYPGCHRTPGSGL
jgi:hypothetical protein